MALLLYRFIQATWRVITDQQIGLIASHEAEELMEEVIQKNTQEGEKN